MLDLAHGLDSCAFGYRGVLLDFGDPSLRASLHALPSARLLGQGSGDVVEREGATWLRVRSRSLAARFYWPAVGVIAPDANVVVEGRVRGAVARAVGVSIDGKNIGVWTLAKDDARVLVARASSPVTLAPGGHELALRFVGGPRSSGEVLAEVDWVHVGASAAGAETYAAPTREDVAIDQTEGDQSLRAVSLRSPGFIRCSGWIPANATLEVSLATAGGGDADVEAYLLRDRRAPVMLGSAHIAGDAGRWVPWSVPVTGVDGAGALISIELVATRAGEGTRVLLGRPEIVASGPSPDAAMTAARSAVLVVLGSTSSSALSPWGGPHPVPELARLASSGTTFTTNRASSSLANSVVASMLTGLSPRVHGLDDPDARLPSGPVMVQEACRQGGIATAMFTANPTTGAAFGFARGWDTFVSESPLEDSPATRVVDDAAEWITAHKASRFFVVVHARGGHP
ncbi:MAG: sulfatase-like hydrolase/transferase, partial [Polyangiaceae bacterium]